MNVEIVVLLITNRWETEQLVQQVGNASAPQAIELLLVQTVTCGRFATPDDLVSFVGFDLNRAFTSTVSNGKFCFRVLAENLQRRHDGALSAVIRSNKHG